MRTLFSHFRNEEYLLPFWLRHHREIFDHGVLIDYHSTDSSCAIIRELVPDWEIVTTSLGDFDPILLDLEVMVQERRFEGWKMCLTTTEFLCAASLEVVEERVEEGDFVGAHGRGVIMVDPEQSGLPLDPTKPLVAQRTVGYFEDEKSWGGFLRRRGINILEPAYRAKNPTLLRVRPRLFKKRTVLMERSRIYHRGQHGAYLPGRHRSYWAGALTTPRDDFLILYYCFSPNTPQMRQRAAGIGGQFSPSNRRLVGEQDYHLTRAQDPTLLDKQRNALVPNSRDLSQNEVFARNTAPWRET